GTIASATVKDGSSVDTELIEFDRFIFRSEVLLPTSPLDALKNGRKALAMAETRKDASLEMKALRVVSDAELQMGLHVEFLRSTLRSLDLATALGDVPMMARALTDISSAYRSNMQMDQAIIEARRALAMIMSTTDQQAISEAHQFLMRTLLHAGHYTEALSNSSQAIASCMELKDEVCQARVHQLMAQLLIAQEKHADSMPFLTKAERVLKEKGDPADRFQIGVDRCKAMLGLGLSGSARTALSEAEALIPVNAPEAIFAILQLKYELALSTEQWRAALGHLQELRTKNDSIHVARIHMKMAGLQVLHDVQVKEQDNAQLRDLNAQQAITIKDQRSNNRQLVILLSGLFILAIALCIISRYAWKVMHRLARKNEVIRRQNEEIQSKVLELKRQNLRLAESLMSEEEKELILKEIHHRVKNNLQVVDSLLNIQSNDVHDPNSLRLLKEAQGRIRSMGMVHEHIYRSSGDINSTLRAHVEKLGRSVLVAHGVHDRISIDVESDLPSFPVETLLPLSLMLNELLTNSIKHAFAGMSAGSIRVAIRTAGAAFELRYTDNGMGMQNGNGAADTGSFGHELITILAQQLNGEIQMLKGKGISFSMIFTPDKQLAKNAA
ncbi:MAG: sensor histidine kinase, partial [Bacteroidota bacterium]|nr:sensor histidine kinase [Bacteroidota bacterium]